MKNRFVFYLFIMSLCLNLMGASRGSAKKAAPPKGSKAELRRTKTDRMNRTSMFQAFLRADIPEIQSFFDKGCSIALAEELFLQVIKAFLDPENVRRNLIQKIHTDEIMSDRGWGMYSGSKTDPRLLMAEIERDIQNFNANAEASVTPAHVKAALKKNRLKLLSILNFLTTKKINFDAKDSSGNTALDLAKQFNLQEMIKILIRHNAHTSAELNKITEAAKIKERQSDVARLVGSRLPPAVSRLVAAYETGSYEDIPEDER